jgi:4-hydroxybenzoate polyprenyltransferase
MTHKLAVYLDLIRWSRPAGWLLLLWPTLTALWLAAGGFPGWHIALVFGVGTVLMRSAGCCVNDVADADFDKHVQRTANRPVTTGRVSRREALMVGVVLALAAFALVLTTTAATVAWSFAAVAIAVAYPFAKRVVSMPQAVLGVAFSMGIPMAFVVHSTADSVWAQAMQLPAAVWWLLLANWLWVLAYDTVYAMVDRDDDLHIGIQTSAITLGRFDVLAVAGFYVLHLALMGWQLAVWHSAVRLVAWCLGVLMVAYCVWRIRTRARPDCFWVFKHNHWLGAVLFAGVLLDSWL